MKAKHVPIQLFLLYVVLSCACSRQKSAFNEADAPHHFKELKRIEILLETQPEVALDSVNILKTRSLQSPFSEIDDKELCLREVQAQYKNRCLTEDSPDLAPVVDSIALPFCFPKMSTCNSFAPILIIIKVWNAPSKAMTFLPLHIT